MLASLRGQYVSVKSAQQQAQGMVFKAWDLGLSEREEISRGISEAILTHDRPSLGPRTCANQPLGLAE